MKNLLLIITLFVLTSCGTTVKTKDGASLKTDNYVGNGVVQKIVFHSEISFIITVKDFDQNDVTFTNDEISYNVGDTIHMDFKNHKYFKITKKYIQDENFKWFMKISEPALITGGS